MTAPPSLEPPTFPPPPGPPDPPPPPGLPVRPPLRRSSTDKVLGGVSGGLAEYSGIDALLWRIGFVALAFAGGSGVLVYLLLWLLMPLDSGGAGGPGRLARRSAPAGPRSPVPGVTVAVLLIVVGLLALLARLTSWSPDGRVFLGAALLVVGLGLVAAAFSDGRTATGGLITLGIVLSLALTAAASAPWDGVRGGVGDRTWAPVDAADVRPVYRGGVGDVELDLGGIGLSGLDGPVRTLLEAGVGDVTVLLPSDADVQVEVNSGLGDVDVLDDEAAEDGLYPGEGSGSWVDDGEAEIVLTVNAGVGDVEVSRG